MATKRSIRIRTRFFLAVEGEGEQSFVRWLQLITDQIKLSVHLDAYLLKGGGYSTMLKKALDRKQRAQKQGQYKSSILLVDGDRADRNDDGWSLDQLKKEANKAKINVCVQNPNLEGVLLRLIPGNESLQPHSSSAEKQLCAAWPEYRKSIDANSLASKFSLSDLQRVARIDMELQWLLSTIGLSLNEKSTF